MPHKAAWSRPVMHWSPAWSCTGTVVNLQAHTLSAAVLIPFAPCILIRTRHHHVCCCTATAASSLTINAVAAFDKLSKALQNLPGMPLRVLNTQAASPGTRAVPCNTTVPHQSTLPPSPFSDSELRYTSIHPPQPHPLLQKSPAQAAGSATQIINSLIHVVVQVETSTHTHTA